MSRLLLLVLLLTGLSLCALAQMPGMMPPPEPPKPAEILIEKGTTLAQLRAVTAWLGAKSKFDAKTKVITLTLDKRVVVLTLNVTTATVDGKAVTLSVAPMAKGGITYVPLRFVGQAFDAKVNWDAKAKEASLTHPSIKTKLYLSVTPFEPSAFFEAVAMGDLDTVKHGLVRHPEMLDAKDPRGGATPTFIAAASGNAEMVAYFVDAGADLTVTVSDADPSSPFNGATLVHAAAIGRSADVLKLFLDKGLKVDVATKGAITPLHLAAYGGALDAVKLLVEKGANVNAKAELPADGLDPKFADITKLETFATPLMLAGMSGQKEVETFLTEKGAKPLEPKVAEFVADMARQRITAGCINNLRNLAMAVMIASQDGGVLPESAKVWEVLKGFGGEAALKCPAKPDAAIGYGFNAVLSGKKMDEIKTPEEIVIFADGGNADHLITDVKDIDITRHGDGFCAVYLSGQATFLKKDDVVKLK